ncbi:hypothetical protein CY652_15080 [Burkholderia sp. WAC0059]|uniref:hypothetical protein n=1 Tax=Burkholderia sp. WAC0059 TaxID=2066022 RepID=UPI000C7E9651|nr:hypothetical protein [Burkholderia sp. WAC0059]PLZ01692.1 hypothetical protein CY652_15080 [Burkholderia sp. WAC0059]
MTDSSARAHPAQRQAFDEWPRTLLDWFDGTALERKLGFTASLVTGRADGRIGTSLLGIGECYAPDSRALCFAVWAGSRTAATLAAGAPAALTFVFDEAFYQVQLDVAAMRSVPAAQHAGLACFRGVLASGEAQRVPYARLTSGMTFELEENRRDEVLERWRAQIAWLREAVSAA